ncbi:MAG: hypothetical protein ACQEUT_05390 [Bacillota bacterium]
MEAAEKEIRLKKNRAYSTRVSVKLMADTLFLLAVLTFFTTEHFFVTAAIPFLFLAIAITFPLVWAGIKSSKKFNGFFLGMSITLFLMGQFSLGLPWWLSLFLLFLLHWRVSTHLEEEKDSRYEVNGGFMLAFLFISLSSYVFQHIYEKQPTEIILFIFISGMIIYSGGTFVVRLTESAGHSTKSTRMKSAKLPLLFAVLLVGLTAVLASVNDTVGGAINYVMEGLFGFLSFLIDPIWKLINWFMGLLPKGVSEGLESIGRPDMPYEITPEQLENSGNNLMLSWWNEALIAVLILVILIYAWRHIKKKGWVEEEESKRYPGFSFQKDTPMPEKSNASNNTSYSEADSEIRKEIFLLEKLAVKKKMSRFNDETLHEWLGRLGFKADDEFYRLYEEVRYGNKEVPMDKTVWFKQCVERVKTSIIGKKS